MPAAPPSPPSPPWYRALGRAQWNALVASNLGWLFDGYETYALVLTAGVASRQLLHPGRVAAGQIPMYAGALIAVTVLGWGLGGMIGGVVADYFGRKRTMMLAIAGYSLTTGLSALAWSWPSLAALRFLVGVAIGSEWVTGASMIAELWPDRARGRAVGLMQCGLGLGFFLASLVWLPVGRTGPGAWRIMFGLGVLPALLTLWVRRAVPESALWRRAADHRRATGGRFTLVDLFATPETRRRTIVAFLMSLATTLGFWGIATWVPPYVASVATARALPGASATAWAGFAGMAYNAGAVGGYVAFGFLADRWGRKPTTLAYFGGALVFVPVLFVWARDPRALLAAAAVLGWFAAGQYTWMSAWLPELYPTRVRATGAGFVFNAPRFIAWVGPLVSGTLIATFGGFDRAALIIGAVYLVGLAMTPLLPETRGRPLPDEPA